MAEAILSKSNGNNRPSRFSICGIISRYLRVSLEIGGSTALETAATEAFARAGVLTILDMVMRVNKKLIMRFVYNQFTPVCGKCPVDSVIAKRSLNFSTLILNQF